MDASDKPGEWKTRSDIGGNETSVLSEQSANNLIAYGALDEDIDNRFNISGEENTAEILDYDEGDDVLNESLDGTATDRWTGGLTDAGETQDLTTAEFSGSRRMGGPSGGGVYGAGAGGGAHAADYAPEYATGGRVSGETHKKTGMAQKTAAQNTAALNGR
jgi:hypothetical protein